MLSSSSLDHIQLLIEERRAQAQHAALVHQALAGRPRPTTRQLRLRPRLATALRHLAYRLDSSLALSA